MRTLTTMAQRRMLASIGLASVALASGCEQPATQVLVAVHSDSVRGTQLEQLRAELYEVDATDPTSAKVVQTYRIDPEEVQTRPGAPHFLLSFGIVKRSADRFKLVLKGYGTDPTTPLVETKLLATFREHEKVVVEPLLRDVCFGQATLCGFENTCVADVRGAACGPLPENPRLRPLVLDEPPDALPDDGADGGGPPGGSVPDASVQDASAQDASMSTPALPDASTPDRLPGANACATPNPCAPEYPCVAGVLGAYQCVGQYAEWPMPDTARGAKFTPRYDFASTPGVVLDQVTGLAWERDLPPAYAECTGRRRSPGDSCSQPEAKRYCSQLRLDNRTWRLPSKVELESLIDLSITSPLLAAMIDPSAFPNAASEQFWTVSSDAFGSNESWTVDFSAGDSHSSANALTYKVRCVSGMAAPFDYPEDRYRVDAASDTVNDARTSLRWQRSVPETAMTWAAADAYCANRGGAWRLPTLKELLTIVDPVRRPSLPAAFPGVPDAWVLWSATPSLTGLGGNWVVSPARGWSTDDGTIARTPGAGSAAISYHVRCVQ